MMKTNLLLISTALLVSIHTNTEATPLPSYCGSIARLQQNVNDCFDNGVVADAAVGCLEDFEGKVQRSSSALASLLQAPKDAGLQQRQSLGVAQADYQKTVATMNLLIQEGEARLREMDALRDNVVFPEDADMPSLTPATFQELLSNSKCYSDNYAVVQSARGNLAKKVNELKIAQAAATSHKSTAETSGTGTESINSATATGTKKSTTAPAIGPAKKSSSSTITGGAEDKAKRNQAPATK